MCTRILSYPAQVDAARLGVNIHQVVNQFGLQVTFWERKIGIDNITQQPMYDAKDIVGSTLTNQVMKWMGFSLFRTSG